jgi:tetratricopeptide (TPR) repeat protein
MSLTGPAKAMVLEAQARARNGRPLEAIRMYEEVLARWPELPECWYSLAYLQRKVGLFSQALESYRQALDHGVSRPEEVHLNRSVIYTDHLHQHEAAERELWTALELRPTYSAALLNLANLNEDLGKRESALAIYERLLATPPQDYEVLARYSNLKSFSDPHDPLIGRLRDTLAAPELNATDRASLGFALGRALDSCGEYAEAFDAYTAANQASRASAPPNTGRYDRESQERLVDRLIAAFPAASSAASPPVIPAVPSPIFICGMFRSGSTLTEQLLAGHPRVSSGGELQLLPNIAREALDSLQGSIDQLPPARLQSLAARYIDSLAQMFPGAQRVTDKRPDNFLHIGLIKRLFPQARIVLTTRDPLDNCLSIFFLHLDQRMSYALNLLDIGHHYRQYLRLMAHWKASYPDDIFELPYDSLVREPKEVMGNLLDFLGLEWSDGCLEIPASGRAIKTASVWQVREPLYQRSSGRSRHYEKQLAALKEYLGLNSTPE